MKSFLKTDQYPRFKYYNIRSKSLDGYGILRLHSMFILNLKNINVQKLAKFRKNLLLLNMKLIQEDFLIYLTCKQIFPHFTCNLIFHIYWEFFCSCQHKRTPACNMISSHICIISKLYCYCGPALTYLRRRASERDNNKNMLLASS